MDPLDDPARPLTRADHDRLSTAELISLLFRRGWPGQQRKNAGLLTEPYRCPPPPSSSPR